jgi:hypothetical protein
VAKLAHALRDAGPHTCVNIREIGGEPFCSHCPYWERITSPIVLGTTSPSTRSETTTRDRSNSRSNPQTRVSRPLIDASVQHLSTVTTKAWGALQAYNQPPRLFRHGGLPSRLERNDDKELIIKDLNPPRMRHVLARAANWYTTAKTKEGIIKVPAKPPRDVVEDVLATPDPPLPVLRRLTEVPVFAPNGALLIQPGYHPETQTYYAPARGYSLPPVSTQPTSEEVTRALRLIKEDMLIDFPFVADADRAHAMGLWLLPYARDLIDGPTPNHLIESPMPGSGKGLLADVLLRPAVGQGMGVTPPASSEEEWRKRLTAFF